MTAIQKLGYGSVLVGLLVLGLKTLAWWLTGSVALLSDALESIINVVASLAALVALQVSAKPADTGHPFGHTKAEYLSAVLEGVLIVLAAVLILREAYSDFLTPKVIESPLLGILINGLALLINAGWAYLLVNRGKTWRSPALVADGRHLFVDVVTSVGVIIGLALVVLTGWAILDPLVATLVAFHILWSGSALVRESVGGLMDQAADEATVKQIHDLIARSGEGAIEAHDIRTRIAANITFIDFHLVVPGRWSVANAHAVCDRLEEILRNNIAGAAISIHVEPENEAKAVGGQGRPESNGIGAVRIKE